MALVKKLNVVLTVDDSLVDSYINKGYSVISENGQVIKEAIPDDLSSLRILVAKQKEEIAKLITKIAEFEAQLKEPQVVPVVDEVEEEAPKKRGRKKATTQDEE